MLTHLLENHVLLVIDTRNFTQPCISTSFVQDLVYSGRSTREAWEKDAAKDAALGVIPVQTLTDAAIETQIQLEGDRKTDFMDFLLKEFAHWFKHSFFKWVDTKVWISSFL